MRQILLYLVLAATANAAPAVVETCKTCHDEDGSGVGKAYVPIIAGIPAVHIEEALFAYKDGARRCEVEPVMCSVAAALSDEQIAELADHYGGLERYSNASTYNEKLAAEGEQLHERLCARCHVPPDDPDVDEALGIPLHGQRADYLRYALESYMVGRREHLLPQMEEKVRQLDNDDVRALIDYYVSY